LFINRVLILLILNINIHIMKNIIFVNSVVFVGSFRYWFCILLIILTVKTWLKGDVWKGCRFYAMIIQLIHLLIGSKRCLFFYNIELFNFIFLSSAISFLFWNTWGEKANLFDEFNLLFSFILPTHYIVARLPILKPLKHCFILL